MKSLMLKKVYGQSTTVSLSVLSQKWASQQLWSILRAITMTVTPLNGLGSLHQSYEETYLLRMWRNWNSEDSDQTDETFLSDGVVYPNYRKYCGGKGERIVHNIGLRIFGRPYIGKKAYWE